MRGISRKLGNEFFKTILKPKTSFKCFSALVSPTPKEAVDFFLQNHELINRKQKSEEGVSNLAQKYFSNLVSKPQNKGDNLGLYLRSLDKFYKTNAESIFFQGVEKSSFKNEKERADFLCFLSNMTANIAGYERQFENNCIEINTRIKDKNGLEESLTTVLPHVDDLFADDRPLEFLTFLGIEAPCKNYRTYILNHKDVVEKLSKKSKTVLQQPIFQDVFENYKAQPILIELGQGDYNINFSTEKKDQPLRFNLNKINDKSLTKNDINTAIRDIESAILNTYRQNKLTEYCIGDMDVLCFKNQLHGRDQIGVSEEYLLSTRRLLSLSYTKKPSPNITPKAITSLKNAFDNQLKL
jgi:hypothetical protein